MLAMSGQDVDAYMKEMEEVHRQTQAEKERELQSRWYLNNISIDGLFKHIMVVTILQVYKFTFFVF